MPNEIKGVKDLKRLPILTRSEIEKNYPKKIIARNSWFQKQTIKKLTQLTTKLSDTPIVFSYSYAALEIFKFAKTQGWKTILGQIDPGLWEEK
ncbi:MAG: hypothetical protein ACKPE1_03055, partial [Dolichospermum sp.]